MGAQSLRQVVGGWAFCQDVRTLPRGQGLGPVFFFFARLGRPSGIRLLLARSFEFPYLVPVGMAPEWDPLMGFGTAVSRFQTCILKDTLDATSCLCLLTWLVGCLTQLFLSIGLLKSPAPLGVRWQQPFPLRLSVLLPPVDRVSTPCSLFRGDSHGCRYPCFDLAWDCHVSAHTCLLYSSPSPRDRLKSRMPSSA